MLFFVVLVSSLGIYTSTQHLIKHNNSLCSSGHITSGHDVKITVNSPSISPITFNQTTCFHLSEDKQTTPKGFLLLTLKNVWQEYTVPKSYYFIHPITNLFCYRIRSNTSVSNLFATTQELCRHFSLDLQLPTKSFHSARCIFCAHIKSDKYQAIYIHSYVWYYTFELVVINEKGRAILTEYITVSTANDIVKSSNENYTIKIKNLQSTRQITPTWAIINPNLTDKIMINVAVNDVLESNIHKMGWLKMTNWDTQRHIFAKATSHLNLFWPYDTKLSLPAFRVTDQMVRLEVIYPLLIQKAKYNNMTSSVRVELRNYPKLQVGLNLKVPRVKFTDVEESYFETFSAELISGYPNTTILNVVIVNGYGMVTLSVGKLVPKPSWTFLLPNVSHTNYTESFIVNRVMNETQWVCLVAISKVPKLLCKYVVISTPSNGTLLANDYSNQSLAALEDQVVGNKITTETVITFVIVTQVVILLCGIIVAIIISKRPNSKRVQSVAVNVPLMPHM